MSKTDILFKKLNILTPSDRILSDGRADSFCIGNWLAVRLIASLATPTAIRSENSVPWKLEEELPAPGFEVSTITKRVSCKRNHLVREQASLAARGSSPRPDKSAVVGLANLVHRAELTACARPSVRQQVLARLPRKLSWVGQREPWALAMSCHFANNLFANALKR